MSRNRVFLLAGLLVALILAGGVSYYASSAPDGLEKVAADKGLDQGARGHHTDGSPLAGYGAQGVGGERLSTGLAGVLGVFVTFGVGAAVLHVVRRRQGPAYGTAEAPAGRAGSPAGDRDIRAG